MLARYADANSASLEPRARTITGPCAPGNESSRTYRSDLVASQRPDLERRKLAGKYFLIVAGVVPSSRDASCIDRPSRRIRLMAWNDRFFASKVLSEIGCPPPPADALRCFLGFERSAMLPRGYQGPNFAPDAKTRFCVRPEYPRRLTALLRRALNVQSE